MKKFFTIFLGITALALAACSGYFSIFGLSKLFMGASLGVIIMAACLEFSKIVVVSYLHQFWETTAKALKAYLLVGIFVLLLITSLGIYGFLSSAYSRVSTSLERNEGTIELFNKKKEIKKGEKDRILELIETKDSRINTLSNQRKSQELRMDTLTMRGWPTTATQTAINKADAEIEKLGTEIDNQNVKIQVINDSIASYDIKILNLGNDDVVADVGPLKYISALTGLSMDRVVNYLILLLIFVFDPLAIALVVATNSIIKMRRQEKSGGEAGGGATGEVVEKIKNVDVVVAAYVPDEQGNFKLKEKIKNIQAKFRREGMVEEELPKMPEIIDERIIDDKEVEIKTLSIDESNQNEALPIENKNNVSESLKTPSIQELTAILPTNTDIIAIEEKEPTSQNVSELVKDIINREISPKVVINEEDLSAETLQSEVQNIEVVPEAAIQPEELPKEQPPADIDNISAITNQPSSYVVTIDKNMSIDGVLTATSQDNSYIAPEQQINLQNVKTLSGLYIDFLNVMFDEGKRAEGEKIPIYKDYRTLLDKNNITYNEKELNDFFIICNLLRITEMNSGQAFINKDYSTSIGLIKNI